MGFSFKLLHIFLPLLTVYIIKLNNDYNGWIGIFTFKLFAGMCHIKAMKISWKSWVYYNQFLCLLLLTNSWSSQYTARIARISVCEALSGVSFSQVFEKGFSFKLLHCLCFSSVYIIKLNNDWNWSFGITYI